MLVNVDPSHAAGHPAAIDLLKWGITGVRLVARPGVDAAAQQYMDAGLMVLSVIARESGGHIGPADVHQVGNEPDSSGPSSWTMSPAQYREEWRIYRETFPDLVLISAGLTSGNVQWWRDLGPLPGCSGMGAHPYNKTAAQARALIRAYKAITPSLPVWATEWWRPANEVTEFAAMLRAECVASAWFCWSDGMVPGFGLAPTTARQLHGIAA
jgi:hypothetical protein